VVTEIYTTYVIQFAPRYLSTLHIAYTNESEKPSIEMAAAHDGVEAARVAASVLLSEVVLPPILREITTWNATNPTMEESAAYLSNPNPSPKSQYRGSSSRFKPGDSNSTNRVVSLSYREPTHDVNLNVEDPHSNSGFRRGVQPLSVRGLVIVCMKTECELFLIYERR